MQAFPEGQGHSIAFAPLEPLARFPVFCTVHWTQVHTGIETSKIMWKYYEIFQIPSWMEQELRSVRSCWNYKVFLGSAARPVWCLGEGGRCGCDRLIVDDWGIIRA
ncbi:hypothetical protein J6590_006109 [Homalodisca vitripennis]|nr:hypothetical protein J6590_006109 [Homalodisca vitripennis]